MNKKYEKYINYIVDDIEPPYFINMRDQYGLSPDEYELVLSKLYKQPVSIKGRNVFDEQGNNIYYESINGFWEKTEHDNLRNIIYFENANGFWEKREYDEQGNMIYAEDSNGYISDRR